MSADSYFIGIDVGTGSARVGLVKGDGTLVASKTQDIQTWRDGHDHRIFEQSTTDIWRAICSCTKSVLATAGVAPASVEGIGIDATCSLAVCDDDGQPISITKDPELGKVGERNIVLWADHRAEKEAELINDTNTVPLKYVGGTMSLEMEVPKVLWLKNNMPQDLFARCHFFDLPDFLTYRLTNSRARSACSLTCKCSFVPSERGWQDEFFKAIGIPEFPAESYRQMGGATPGDVLSAGAPIGKGLTKEAAEEMGLVEGTPVGAGVIDAYAGWLGTVAARYVQDGKPTESTPALEESGHRLAAVAGTSTCYIVQGPDGVFVNGVWGPYKDVVFPGWWMNEGGQSSTGQLIDFVITTHPAYQQLVDLAREKNSNIHTVLHQQLEHLRDKEGLGSFTEVTKHMHFYPDLHGNRSPLADPRMRGSFVGLALDSSLSDLARKFNLALESIALQTRHILDSLSAAGHDVRAVHVSGGQARNVALMQLLADCCGVPVVLPEGGSGGGDAVVRGAAMLGRFASEKQQKGEMEPRLHGEALWRIMVEMTPPGTVVPPAATAKEKKLLEAKYKIFREAIDIQLRWRQQMEEASR